MTAPLPGAPVTGTPAMRAAWCDGVLHAAARLDRLADVAPELWMRQAFANAAAALRDEAKMTGGTLPAEAQAITGGADCGQ